MECLYHQRFNLFLSLRAIIREAIILFNNNDVYLVYWLQASNVNYLMLTTLELL